MKFSLVRGVALPLLLCSLGAQSPAALASEVDGARVGVIDTAFTFADPLYGALPNGQAHAHDQLWSHLGWQYATYWDFDRRLVVARRELPSGPWEIARFEDDRILSEDAHNATVIGISSSDGRIHLAFDHHVDDLNYRQSVPGLVDDPGAFEWGVDLFGETLDTLDPERGPVTELTYPRFVETPSGDLLFVYREFSSGNGRIRLVDYSSEVWQDDRVFIERTGSHSDLLGGDSESRNPYFNRIAFDDEGTLHATWTWRERGPIPYNRDIAYAYSEDGGKSWLNNSNEPVADTLAGEVITAATPGIAVVTLGAEWGLMNNQAHVVDPSGRVHVVMYHKDEPDDEVSYGDTSNSHYRHFWRAADGVWRDSWLSTIGNRPRLFAGPDDHVILAYKSPANELVLDVASPAGDYLDWSSIWSGGARLGSSAQGDHARWRDEEILSIVMQRQTAEAGEITPIGVFDLRLQLDVPEPDHVLTPNADAHVRAGIHADTNYAFEATLEIKENNGEDFDRIAYLRFDLSELAGSSIARAELEVTRSSAGARGVTTPIEASHVRDDAWSESTITWNDRPVIDEALDSHYGRAEMSWDVTAAAIEATDGDGELSVALVSLRQGADRSVNVRSREGAEGERPRLLIYLE